MRLMEGSPLLRQYLVWFAVTAAAALALLDLASRLKRDDSEGLVAWLPEGTPLLRPGLADGCDLLSVPVAERYDLDRNADDGVGGHSWLEAGRPSLPEFDSSRAGQAHQGHPG